MVTIGLLVLALLPVAAAVSPDDAAAPDVPVAITQPIGNFAVVHSRGQAALSESAMTLLVGGGLIGLASIVRRTTRA